MLLDRVAKTGATPRVGHPQVITVAELLGRESATPRQGASIRQNTAVRPPVRVPLPAPEPRYNGTWVNRATVVTAAVTFGSVLAVGSTFLPHSNQAADPNAGTSTDPSVTEALAGKPPSVAPVTKPAAARLGAPKVAPGAPNPAPAKPVTPNPSGPSPGLTPIHLPGPAVQSRPLAGAQSRARPLPGHPTATPSGPAGGGPAAPVPRAAAPAPAARVAQPAVPAPAARVPQASTSAAAGGPAKPSKSSKSGKSNKSGAHRATAQRPATAGKSAAPKTPSARANAPKGGLGGVVSGLTGGLL